MSAFIDIFSTTDGKSQSLQSGNKPWTGLRNTLGEFGDDWSTCLYSKEERVLLYENRTKSRDSAGLVMRGDVVEGRY